MTSQEKSLRNLVHGATDTQENRPSRIIGYLPGLYPDRGTYQKALGIISHSGIRAIEIGIPGTIGELEGGIIADALRRVHRRTPSILDVMTLAVQDVLQAGLIPIVMAFRDTVFENHGYEVFLDTVNRAGGTLVLVPDVNSDEYRLLCDYGESRGIQVVPFASATDHVTSDFPEAPLIYMQTADVPTGGDFVPGEELRRRIQDHTVRYPQVPVGVGFGIRTSEDVTQVHNLGADFAIIGTAMVEALNRGIESFKTYVGTLTGTLEGAS